MMPAMYIYRFRGENRYLFDSEVCRASKFELNEIGGFSPILTIFEKALTLIGMDKTAFRYFFERKMPPSMLMVFTDDVEGLRRERERLKMEMQKDPDYIPMLGVSAKAGSRGRVDLVRLFHTLTEMDYMPIKNEIRERIAALWGVTPIWQASVDTIGGMSAQSAQLVVTSRVVESDQAIFEEKIFPFVGDAFGITDWILRLRNPEEKAEATRIQFAQQRISCANMLFQMGFDISLRSEVKTIDDVDFEISGKAQRPEEMGGGAMGGGMPGAEGANMPPGQEQGGEGQGGEVPQEQEQDQSGENIPPPIEATQKTEEESEEQQKEKAKLKELGRFLPFEEKAWFPQINKAGYIMEALDSVNIAPDGSGVTVQFKAQGATHVATFEPTGKLKGINKATPGYMPGMHQHAGFEYLHPSDMRHDGDTKAHKHEKTSGLFEDNDE
jgi:hypothetical protein